MVKLVSGCEEDYMIEMDLDMEINSVPSDY